jgi:predicted ferric reductase
MTTTMRSPHPMQAAPERARRVSPPQGLLAFVAGISLFVVYLLWVHGGNLSALRAGGGATLTSLGRLTGLFSADLLLIQVLMMARVPWIERAFGQDTLARYHRIVGFTSINLMLVHVVAITVGYAATDHHGLIGEAWSLVTTYPGMLLATAASAALIMVAVTSVRAARRRLRYESWHLLHLYAYLGVGLALPHEIWTGEDFVGTAPARAYWWTLYLVTAGAIVVFRLGLPVWRSIRHDLRVAAVIEETPGVISVYLNGRHLDRLGVRAGQFFNWRFLSHEGWTRAHPYSLSAAPRRDQLRITVKDLGDGSQALRHLRRGTRVLIEGPYGRLTGDRRRRPAMTLLACGIGITPLRAILESEPYHPGHATLIYRASRNEDFTFAAELEALARVRGVQLYYLPGPRHPDVSWAPATMSNPIGTLTRMAPLIASTDVFVCGPFDWMESVIATLRSLGVPPAQIHHERFGW